MTSLTMPACVVEDDPFGSLGGSGALTKGHRWKMLALVLVVLAFGAGLLVANRLVLRVILASGPSGVVAPLAFMSTLIWGGLWVAFFAVLLAVSYHAMRAAKDKSDQLATIFE